MKNNVINSNIIGFNVEENEQEIKVKISTHKPGFIIGKMGKTIDTIQNDLTYIFNKKTIIDLEEVKKRLFEIDFFNMY